MNKIKKGMIELEETKRINKELLKIFQEQEQFTLQANKHPNGPIHDHQQAMRHYREVNSFINLKDFNSTSILDNVTSTTVIRSFVDFTQFRTATTTSSTIDYDR